MIAQELEVSLHMAFVEARQQRHEFITVEHLLLALLDNPSAAEVLRACSANIDDLRKSLANFIKDNTPQVAGTDDVDTQPTLGFQRVIQRAIMHVQSTGNGKKEVTGANVLVAIFGEKDSHAVYYLHQQGVTRLDVVNYIAHGIKKSDPPEPAKGGESSGSEGEEGGEKNEKASPLEQFTLNLNQAAKDGKIDPLIGREYEVERVIQILCRRRKNNPLLVGEAGVGKTAIAEGLAWRITQGDVPEVLGNAMRHTATRVLLTARREGGLLQLRIDDDGVGFPPGQEQRDQLFRRFQPRDQVRGLGISLSLVSDVVRAHGGSIEIGESQLPVGRLGKPGAAIILVLPAEPQSRSESRPESRKEPP
jgi:ATP-dependent Clp protease ATP-binding subunit ClpA